VSPVDVAPPTALAAFAPLLDRATALPRDSADRGALMACWMVARLAALRLLEQGERPAVDALRQRGEAGRAWCEGLALPPAVRTAALRACLAVADEPPAVAADAIEALRPACGSRLDAEADAVLASLVARLRGAAAPPSLRP
jgi:hypothetical protein